MFILGINGGIGSGKDSAAKYILGKVLVHRNVLEVAEQNESGDLLVNYESRNKSGQIEKGVGIFDINRRDPAFISYLNEVIWPHAKIYHFADLLKEIAVNLYGLSYEEVFGTQEDKSKHCHIKWSQVYESIPKTIRPKKNKAQLDEFMTNREFLQTLGDILRGVSNECLTKALMNQILVEQPGVAIIADVREEQEIDMINTCGGKVIRLLKTTTEDKHRTEVSMLKVDESKFSCIIDNRFCDIHEKNKQLYLFLKEWGLS